jgi:hypothetical protein
VTRLLAAEATIEPFDVLGLRHVEKVLVEIRADQFSTARCEAGVTELFEKGRETARNSGVEHDLRAARFDIADSLAIVEMLEREVFLVDDRAAICDDDVMPEKAARCIEEGGASPRGHADLRIEALDMVVRGFGAILSLPAASLAVSPPAISHKTSKTLRDHQFPAPSPRTNRGAAAETASSKPRRPAELCRLSSDRLSGVISRP